MPTLTPPPAPRKPAAAPRPPGRAARALDFGDAQALDAQALQAFSELNIN